MLRQFRAQNIARLKYSEEDSPLRTGNFAHKDAVQFERCRCPSESLRRSKIDSIGRNKSHELRAI